MNFIHCGSEQFGLQPASLLNFSFSSLLIAVGNRQKRLSNTTLDSLLLGFCSLAFFFKFAIAPVGMWKSGAGWANRWAGVFCPSTGLSTPLSRVRPARPISTYPRATNPRRQGCRRKKPPAGGRLLLRGLPRKMGNGRIPGCASHRSRAHRYTQMLEPVI